MEQEVGHLPVMLEEVILALSPHPGSFQIDATVGGGGHAIRILEAAKPGGRLLILEFSKPENELLGKAYDTYSFKVLPILGKLVANDSDSYQYLAESIRVHPDQETLKDMMEDAGFSRCEYHNMTGGVVALHKGIKP